MDPGERDRYVGIEQVTQSIGASRMPVETWVPLVNMFMSKQDVSGRERLATGQVTAPFDTRWVMKYRSDMDPELVDVPQRRRLNYRSRIHNIVFARQVDRDSTIELLTTARQG